MPRRIHQLKQRMNLVFFKKNDEPHAPVEVRKIRLEIYHFECNQNMILNSSKKKLIPNLNGIKRKKMENSAVEIKNNCKKQPPPQSSMATSPFLP